MSIATYSFLPYLRQGLANKLKNTGGARAVYTVSLTVKGDTGASEVIPPRDVALYGPGDIIGIDPRSILKTDPHILITNFEPNYLAYIDFYDEDYPWRYTPLQPESPHRLKPWIALIVLKQGEFDEGKNLMDRPLPYITLNGVTAAQVFPQFDQLWAWAHVHVNTDIVSDTLKDQPADVTGVLKNLQDTLDADPDKAYSRLVCPRKLEKNATYHAFVIPVFASGWLAGVGKSAVEIAAAGTKVAWDADGNLPSPEIPIYHRWQFATGDEGDFEYLVRLLKPMQCDLRVGRRDMDMTKPGANLRWVEADEFSLEGILRLGGALQVPRKTLLPEVRDHLEILDGWGKDRLPHPFQKQIAALLNLADDYSYKKPGEANAEAELKAELPIDPNDDADPLITPPIYGRWHAMIERVLQDRDSKPIHNDYNWINELNLDPRYRVPAHFGTRVVQQNQEEYMNAAWEQVGDVLKANEQIRFGQFGQASSWIYYKKNLIDLANINLSKALMLTAPVQSRILMDGHTVFHTMRESVLPNAVVSPAMRRIIRPRGRFIKDLLSHSNENNFRPDAVVEKLNEGKIHVSPEKAIAPEMPSANKLGSLFEPTSIPKFFSNLLRSFPFLPQLCLIFALIILLIFVVSGGLILSGIGILIAAGLLYLFQLFNKWKKFIKAADAIRPENQTPEAVDALPKSSDFQLVSFETVFRPVTRGTNDNTDAIKFKQGLRDTFELVQATRKAIPPPKKLKKLETRNVIDFTITKLDPAVTIPQWTWQNIRLPEWIRSQMVSEFFTEAMAYPRFDLPMYKPLADISAELFLPNINLIEYNSITLLETNQEFIEAYMVGLNHEFARELLWREYPTDQRGSYFRQFWDVSTLLNTNDPTHVGKTEEEIRELYRDIPKLHVWPRASKLGEHDHRQRPGEPEIEEVVLVIRGELLKKYPNAVVYAHKAEWQKDDAGNYDKKQARILHQEAQGENEKPPFDVIRTPLYKAQVEPDITFFGFKLDVKDAKGDSDPETPNLKNAGWFFVIKERPGEPRFGFDVVRKEEDSKPNLTWNDLSWSEVPMKNQVIDVNGANPPKLSGLVPPNDSPSFVAQRAEDKKIFWNSGGHTVDAADMAYILYQVPVLVAVHASEMLPKIDQQI